MKSATFSRKKTFRILPFIVLLLALILNSACANDAASAPDKNRPNSGDDDFITDDDDAAADDGDDAPIGGEIISPQYGVNYYTSEILLVTDRSVLNPAVRILVDGHAVKSAMVQWLNPDDGRHEVQLMNGDEVIALSSFEVRAGETTQYTEQHTGPLPAAVTLPEAQGASTPIRLHVENAGETAAAHLRFYTEGMLDFRSFEAIQDYLLEAVDGMSAQEKALYLFHFLIDLSLTGPPWSMDTFIPQEIPQFFSMWGVGNCGDQASVLAQLAQMVGWTADDAKSYCLNGHTFAELNYDGAWHLFDPMSCSYYWDDAGRLLSYEDIQQNPDQILDYTDPNHFSPCRVNMKVIEAEYASLSDNHDCPTPLKISPESDLRLDPGDTLDLYPWGYRIATCVNCDDLPRNVGTGVLTRRVTGADAGGEIAVDLPFAIGALNLTATAGALPVKTSLQVKLIGSLETAEETIDIILDGETWFDSSPLFTEQELGIVSSVRIRFTDPPASLEKIVAEVFFQFPPRWFPRISHENRELLIDGEAEDLRVSLDYHDRVDDIRSVIFSAFLESDPPAIPGDGRHLVTFYAMPVAADGEPAVGHELDLVSDHPEEVEIFTMSRAGYDAVEAVPSRWLGAARQKAQNGYYKLFFARTRFKISESVGPVTFTLLVDGEAIAETSVQFLAE